MTNADRPDILCPPPLLYAAAFVLVLGLRWGWPVRLLPDPIALWSGVALVAAGISLNAWGAWSMMRARTPINPYRPAAALVTTGAFSLSRNPLYVGLDAVFVGLTLILNTLWGLLVLLPLLALMHYGVILREERHLEGRFGEPYRRYCARVRRYL